MEIVKYFFEMEHKLFIILSFKFLAKSTIEMKHIQSFVCGLCSSFRIFFASQWNPYDSINAAEYEQNITFYRFKDS